MRVAIVSPYALDRPGGVQSHARQLTLWLNELGVDAWLVGPGRGSGDTIERRVGGGMTIRANRSNVPLSLDPRVAVRLRRELDEADLVHVHEPWIPLAGWAALAGDQPRVLTFHADPGPLVRRLYRVMRVPLRRIVERAAAVTTVSAVSAKAIAGFAPNPALIPNAVDRNPGAGRTGRGATVVFVGRDEERKGLGVLLAAWPGVLARVPEARLRVITPIPREAQPGVDFLVLDDPARDAVLADSAIFVAPNLGGESFGITVAEAMAAGCAVITSDLPAFVGLVGEAGVQVPAGDPVTLGDVVGDLLADPSRVEQLAGAARRRVEQFTWETVAPRYVDLYRKVLAGDSPEGTTRA